MFVCLQITYKERNARVHEGGKCVLVAQCAQAVIRNINENMTNWPQHGVPAIHLKWQHLTLQILILRPRLNAKNANIKLTQSFPN